MASLVSRARRNLERGLTLVSRPGFVPMLGRLSCVWSVELIAAPAVTVAVRLLDDEGRERLVAKQNELRGRALRWACPELS
jgi:hypothetical protein